VGISYPGVAAALEADGVEKFIASWDELVHTVSSALAAAR
jgi:transaldolase